MEVVTEDQGPRGFEHELSQIVDATTDNQDDEFDFTIGGEDDLDPNAEDYQTHGVVSGEAGQNEVDEISVNYKAEDQEGDTNEVLALAEDEQRDDANDEMHELNDDHAGAIEYANEGDENNATEQTRSRSEEETVEQNPTEEHVEDVVEEEIYYQMAEEESEAFEDNAQPEPDHEPVDMEHATSVDYASGNEEVDNHDEARVDEDQVSGSQNVVIEIEQSAAVELREEQSQYVGGDIGGGEPSFDNDDQDNMSSKDDSVTDPVDKSQDHGIWDVEEHDDEDSDRRPQVTISYQSQDYSLFAEFPDQSPDHYFLSDLDLLHSPLSQLLASIREVISDEIATAQEVFLRVNGLGFEFAESTTKDFLDATTFAHIIEVNKQLVANEGGSPSPILECYIGLRPSCLHRFSELSKAAEEGKGLSDVAMFYDDVSANESMEEYEEHDFSQDMISDSPSLDDAAIVDNDTTGNNIDANDTEQYFNAFQPTEEPLQSIDEPNIPVVEEGEFAEQGEYSAEALSVDSTEFEGAKAFENVSGDVDDELHANNAEALDFTRDSSGHDEGVYDQSITEDAGVVDVDLNDEMRTELSQEHNGQIDGTIANPADDQDDHNDTGDDYLDLGNSYGDVDTNVEPMDPANAVNDEQAQRSVPPSISPQTPHHSSATATLDGNDNGHDDIAPVGHDAIDSGESQNEADGHAPTGEVDEIDWNNDEEGDLDDANQNPTTISPSSPSAKRNREEDEIADVLVDENAVKRRRT